MPDQDKCTVVAAPLSVEELEDLRAKLTPRSDNYEHLSRLLATVDGQKRQLRRNANRRRKYLQHRLRWGDHMRDLGRRYEALRAERDALEKALQRGWSWGQYQWALAHPDELPPSKPVIEPVGFGNFKVDL